MLEKGPNVNEPHRVRTGREQHDRKRAFSQRNLAQFGANSLRNG